MIKYYHQILVKILEELIINDSQPENENNL